MNFLKDNLWYNLAQTAAQQQIRCVKDIQIAGTIVDETNKPIPSATLTLFINQCEIANTTSDSDGYFHFSNLKPRNYTIVISSPGYSTTMVATHPLSSMKDLKIVLNPNKDTTVPLRGLVTDEDGSPISCAVITIRSVQSGHILGKAISDKSGCYSIFGLLPGSYYMIVFAEHYQHACKGVLKDAGEERFVQTTLTKGAAEIVGQVFDASTNQPLAADIIALELFNEEKILIKNLYADAQGNFNLEGLSPGTYTIKASMPGFQCNAGGISVGVCQTAYLGISLLPSTGHVYGKVTNTVGECLNGALITVYDQYQALIQTTITDCQGEFLLEDLCPGQHTIVASLASYQNELIGVSVSKDKVSTVSLVLHDNPGSITGAISVSHSKFALIQIYNDMGQFIAKTVTAQDGSFTFHGLAPGIYTCLALAHEAASVYKTIKVMANQVVRLTLNLQTRNQKKISCSILPTDDEIIQNTYITVQDMNGIIVDSIHTDNSGKGLFSKLPPGCYVFNAFSRKGYAHTTKHLLLEHDHKEEYIKLPLYHYPLSGSISGHISHAETKQSIKNAVIKLYSADLDFINIMTVQANANGHYYLSGIAPGDYLLTIAAKNFAFAKHRIMVSAGQTVNGNVEIGSHFGILNGTIEGKLSDHKESINVDQPILVQVCNTESTWRTYALVSNKGEYDLSGIPPGNYLVNVLSYGQSIIKSEKKVNIEEGCTTYLNLQVDQGNQSLLGRIVSNRGALPVLPVKDCLVLLTTPANVLVSLQLTSNAGDFAFDDINEGTYLVQAKSGVHAQHLQYITINAAENSRAKHNRHSRETFAKPKHITISLTTIKGAVRGNIIDSISGKPVRFANVQLLDNFYRSLITLPVNQQGEYHTEDLPLGTYLVKVQAKGYSPKITSLVINSTSIERIDFALVEAATDIVEGIVTDAFTEKIIPNAEVAVRMYNSFGPVVNRALTDHQGRFQLSGLSVGSHTVFIHANGFAREYKTCVIEPNQCKPLQFELLPDPAMAYCLVVDHRNRGIGDAIINLYDANKMLIDEGITDHNGVVIFNHIQGGSYTISALHPGLNSATSSFSVDYGEKASIKLTLGKRSTIIEGKVITEEDHKPIIGSAITLIDSNGMPVAHTISNIYGVYSFKGISPGHYQITASGTSFGTKGKALNTRESKTHQCRIRLSQKHGSIMGRVSDEDGSALEMVLVELTNTRYSLIRATVTDLNGEYLLDLVTPGSYIIRFSYPDKELLVKRIRVENNNTTILNAILMDDESKKDGFEDDDDISFSDIHSQFFLDNGQELEDDD